MILFARLMLALGVMAGDPEKFEGYALPPFAVADVRRVAFDVGAAPAHWCRTEEEGGSFEDDILIIRLGFVEALDCPPATDVRLLPADKAVWAMIRANDMFCERVRQLIEVDAVHRRDNEVYLAEAEAIGAVLREAYTAVSDYAPYDRRRALQYLRDLLGWENYYRGQLPPAVPIWRLPTYP